MIDPHAVTNHNRTPHELEEFAVFSVLVAGRTAVSTARSLENILNEIKTNVGKELSPIELIISLETKQTLAITLKKHGVGCYTKKASYVWSLCTAVSTGKINLITSSVDDFERLPGFGAKTARFFLLHSRANQRLAALDTHMLAHLRKNGIKAPKVSPPKGKKYEALETQWLKLCDTSGLTPAEYDLKIWCESTKTKPITQHVQKAKPRRSRKVT